MTRGPGPLELIVQLPNRDLCYVAENEEDHLAWIDAANKALDSDIEKHYNIENVVGEGAFAKVHLGKLRSTGEKCAIKVVNKVDQSPKDMEFILREMDIMMKVSHPSIVSTYDIFDSPNVLHLVIEYMEGGELFDIIADKDRLSEQQASQVVRDIIRGCEYLHAMDVVHCDIKPENILCKTTEWPLDVKLCDFGLSNYIDRSAGADASENTMTAVIGTPGYVAPEVIKREPYGKAVDMWSCGVVLYVMLSGRMPFYGRNDVDCLRRTASGEYSFPDEQWKNISGDAISLVKSLLQVDPEKRLTARAALNHRWLETPEHNSALPIENNLRELHSSRRKLKKVIMGVLTIQKMEGLLAKAAASGQSPS